MKCFLSYDDIFIGYFREIQFVFTDCWKKSVFQTDFFFFLVVQFYHMYTENFWNQQILHSNIVPG